MDYSHIEDRLERLACAKGVRACDIGRSEAGQIIRGFHFGSNSNRQVIIQAAIHAREYLSALLAINLCEAWATMEWNLGCWVIPVMNPDGVRLCCNGLKSVESAAKREFLMSVNKGSDFSLWKANINAVDLNTNFNARWGEGASNVRYPSSANYIGERAASEAETRSLTAFTNMIRPFATLSYHCKGQEIYWDFDQKGALREKSLKIGQELEKATGYKLIQGTQNSAGGYKDWCALRLKIPAYTLEIIDDKWQHPLSIDSLEGEYERNKDVLSVLEELD